MLIFIIFVEVIETLIFKSEYHTMKEAIAILTGGGPAPGMNTVVGSVAKTFLA